MQKSHIPSPQRTPDLGLGQAAESRDRWKTRIPVLTGLTSEIRTLISVALY
jgi:hypothetical protein